MNVAGTIVSDYNIEDPDFATNEVAKSAMKKAVATMAGNGVDSSDVVDLQILPDPTDPGRRLVTMSNSTTLRTSYVIVVPSSVVDDIRAKLRSRQNDEVARIFTAQMASIGKDVVIVVTEMPLADARPIPPVSTTGVASLSQDAVDGDFSGSFSLHAMISRLHSGLILVGSICLLPHV